MTAVTPRRSKAWVRQLYEGGSPAAHRFRYALARLRSRHAAVHRRTSFAPRNAVVEALDVLFGLVILADFGARLLHQPPPAARPAAPAHLGRHRGDRLVPRAAGRAKPRASCASCARCGCCAATSCWCGCGATSRYFRANEEIIIAVANLAVFLFVMTGFVYETQHATNPEITNYADALYFTVTALTTTGFGDITLPGTSGRLISVAIMIFGVTLFFGLAARRAAPEQGALSLPDLRRCCATIPTRCTARPAGRC